MNLKDLVTIWEKTAASPLTKQKFGVHLTAKDAAKIAALTEMYPSRTAEQIISELLSAALDELEYTLPYVKGEKISSLDELGDPIYEDVGPTSTFSTLTRKHLDENQQH
jgi:hypothetical protein